MTEHILAQITSILFLGIGSQWVAWRMRLPSILMLLVAGFVAGPVTHHQWIDPDAMFGDVLMPFVSVSVGLIMFEGGLTLKFRELDDIGPVVLRLVSLGAAVTWGMTILLARLCLGWDWALCALLGAILVVTGPTVIMPLLRFLQPNRQVASALKWEGIMIDPVGALLALLVFESIHHGMGEHGVTWHHFPLAAAWGFGKTLLAGGLTGGVGALWIYHFYKRHWVPEYLQSPFALMVAVLAFAGANFFQHEAGLLATTVMGLILANQKHVDIRHILEFKENLRVLLISVLFIVLSARLHLEDFSALPLGGVLLFLLGLLLVVRPATVWLSCAGSSLKTSERWFLSWMAPRGIVAAAVASVFSMRLVEDGMAGAELLTPVIFVVIVGTVLVYGLTAPAVARRLNVSSPDPQGVLIAGAHDLGRGLGMALQKEGFKVLMVDNNRQHINQARMDGLPVHYGSILSEDAFDELDLAGIGRFIALTPNHRVNSLAAIHFSEMFGRTGVFQLPDHPGKSQRTESFSEGLQGRTLFSKETTYEWFNERLGAGYVIKRTAMTENFDFEDFRSEYQSDVCPMFLVTENKKLHIITTGQAIKPGKGQVLISLVPVLSDKQPSKIDQE
ncbi:MAG: cation:proton antiporter [Verrucomicrobiota bacterium]